MFDNQRDAQDYNVKFQGKLRGQQRVGLVRKVAAFASDSVTRIVIVS